jgi:precorrin-2 methylase
MSGVITCVGVGLSPKDHLTLEGLRALRASACVFYPNELEGIAELIADELLVGEDVTRALACATARVDAHTAIAERIVAFARRGGDAVWATLGSPAVVCGVTETIEKLAAKSGIETRRVLSISSFDLIASEFRLDHGNAGLQVIGATALLVGKARPNPRMGAIVMMVARAETALGILDARLKPPALERLARALAEVYPADHPAHLFTSARGRTPERRYATTVGALAAAYEHVDPWASLYLPPLPVAFDAAEVARLYDYQHRVTHYETPLEALLRAQPEVHS